MRMHDAQGMQHHLMMSAWLSSCMSSTVSSSAIFNVANWLAIVAIAIYAAS